MDLKFGPVRHDSHGKTFKPPNPRVEAANSVAKVCASILVVCELRCCADWPWLGRIRAAADACSRFDARFRLSHAATRRQGVEGAVAGAVAVVAGTGRALWSHRAIGERLRRYARGCSVWRDSQGLHLPGHCDSHKVGLFVLSLLIVYHSVSSQTARFHVRPPSLPPKSLLHVAAHHRPGLVPPGLARKVEVRVIPVICTHPLRRSKSTPASRALSSLSSLCAQRQARWCCPFLATSSATRRRPEGASL